LTDAAAFAAWPEELRTHLQSAVEQSAGSLAAAGLLERSGEGLWLATERGRQAAAQGEGQQERPAVSPATLRGRRASGTGGEAPRLPSELAAEPPCEAAPAVVMSHAQARQDEELARTLLARLWQAPPAFLEQAVLSLLVAMGYGRSSPEAKLQFRSHGDGGIDGLIEADALGLDRLCVQTKRYGKGKLVGASSVRNFIGALDRAQATKGVLATTSGFSPEALRTAETLGKRVVLLDGPALARLMIRHGVGCKVKASYRVMALDEGFFAEQAAAA